MSKQKLSTIMHKRIFGIWLIYMVMTSNVCVFGDIFSSISAMERLLNGELNAVAAVEEYIKMEVQRHQVLRQLANEYETRSRQWCQSIDGRFLENPVAAYLILKRLAAGWVKIETEMKKNSARDVIRRVTKFSSHEIRLFAPNETDVAGAAIALMRLQDTYNLETNLVANGYLPGVPTFGSLTARDCFDIGVIAYNLSDDYHAILWFEEALNRLKSVYNAETEIDEATILDYLANSFYQQKFYGRAVYLAKRLLELEPENKESAESLEMYEAKLIELREQGALDEWMAAETEWSPTRIRRNQSQHADVHYEALCRGEENVQINNLTCYYKADTPFLRLAPFKVEILHASPDILLFRNVISVEEIDIVKKLSSPELSRSEVTSDNGHNHFADYRISQTTWLEDDADPLIARLTRRVGDMSGLDVKHAEQAQIANYGLGGHYEQHHDCGLFYMKPSEESDHFASRYNDERNRKVSSDDRIATLMFYLVQPVSGGATVFTGIDVTVFPTARDAVFWFNVYKNGTAVDSVVHAACPVLAGSKWVLNKWISSKNQEFIYRCGLKEDE